MISAVRRRSWQPYLRLAQIGGTLCLLVLLLWKLDWSALRPLLASLRWELVGLGLLIILACHLVNVERWRYLLHDGRAGYRQLLIYYGAGLFSNNFLPTGIGGDGVRVALLSRDVPLSRALISVGLDRGLGLLALATLMLPGLWLGLPPGLERAGDSIRVTALIGLAALGGLLLLGWLARSLGWSALSQTTVWRWLGVERLSHELGQGWLRRLLGGYGISLISVGGLVVAYWVVLHAIGAPVGSAVALWLLVVGSFSLLLPVAVNGLGLQEGVYVVLLTHYGLAPSVGLSFALLARLLMVLPSLLGGLLSLWKQR